MAKRKVVNKKGVPTKKRSKKSRPKHSDVPKRGGGYQPKAVEASMGNQWWNLRSKHGRDKIFESPEVMWEAACEYFKWCVENPLKEQKVFHSDGTITKADVNRTRAFTMHGLCLFLGVNTVYFRNFKNQRRVGGEDFSSVIQQIEEVIYRQKFESAACDLLNANIISRDLGLAENQNVNVHAERKSVAELFPSELDSI